MTQVRRLNLSSIYLAAIGIGALLSMASPRLAPLIVFTIGGTYVLARWRFRKGLPATPANLALSLLTCVVLVNSLVSVRPEVTFPAAMQLLIGISLLFSVSNWIAQAEHLHQAPVALAIIGIVLVIMAPFTVDWITDKYALFPSSLYTMLLPLTRRIIHPNVIAGAVAVLLVTLVVFQRFSWHVLHTLDRSILILASVALSVLLVFTQSRGALLGVLFGLASMMVISLDLRKIGIVVMVASTVFVAIVWIVGADAALIIGSSASVRGASGRVEIWAHAIAVISDFRFSGIGIGNFATVTDLFYPFLVAGPSQTHAHNMFLQIAVDTGLTGLIIWLSCLFLVLFCCIQTFRACYTRKSPLLTGVSAGLLCGQLTMLVHGLMDAPLWATRPSIVVWILWGMALALPALSTTAPEQVSVQERSQTGLE